MTDARKAGILWIVAAILAAAVTLVFRVVPEQSAITNAASAIAVAIGALLVRRPEAAVVSASSAFGVAWVTLYVALIVIQSDEIAAWSTDAILAVFGGLAGLIGYRSSRP
jgi:hypothetical protein